jgi:hypothetical protein
MPWPENTQNLPSYGSTLDDELKNEYERLEYPESEVKIKSQRGKGIPYLGSEVTFGDEVA